METRFIPELKIKFSSLNATGHSITWYQWHLSIDIKILCSNQQRLFICVNCDNCIHNEGGKIKVREDQSGGGLCHLKCALWGERYWNLWLTGARCFESNGRPQSSIYRESRYRRPDLKPCQTLIKPYSGLVKMSEATVSNFSQDLNENNEKIEWRFSGNFDLKTML